MSPRGTTVSTHAWIFLKTQLRVGLDVANERGQFQTTRKGNRLPELAALFERGNLRKFARTVIGTNNVDHSAGVDCNNSVEVLLEMIGVLVGSA
jgi:anaerobic selenocysteine-containing dehydrogenase